jgi:hypothetical protein
LAPVDGASVLILTCHHSHWKDPKRLVFFCTFLKITAISYKSTGVRTRGGPGQGIGGFPENVLAFPGRVINCDDAALESDIARRSLAFFGAPGTVDYYMERRFLQLPSREGRKIVHLLIPDKTENGALWIVRIVLTLFRATILQARKGNIPMYYKAVTRKKGDFPYENSLRKD